jgi:hypothetical protein
MTNIKLHEKLGNSVEGINIVRNERRKGETKRKKREKNVKSKRKNERG